MFFLLAYKMALLLTIGPGTPLGMFLDNGKRGCVLSNRLLKENGLKKTKRERQRVKTSVLLSQSLSGIIGQQKALMVPLPGLLKDRAPRKRFFFFLSSFSLIDKALQILASDPEQPFPSSLHELPQEGKTAGRI